MGAQLPNKRRPIVGLMKRWRRLSEDAVDEETGEEIEIRRKRMIQYRDDKKPGELPDLEDLTIEDLNLKLTDVFETEHGRRRMLVADNVSTTQRDKKGRPYPSEGIALIGDTEVTNRETEEVTQSIFVDPVDRKYAGKPSAAKAPDNTVDATI
jgi:hypothetical protein